MLTWNITGTTGASSGVVASAPALGASGSDLTVGGATGNSTSPSNTWNRSFALSADVGAAQTAGNYFSWTTTAAAGYTITFNGLSGLNLSRTTTGPASAELWYSTDGTTFNKTGNTFTVGTTLASAASALAATITTTPIVIVGGVSSPTVGYWRLVVYGGAGTSRMGIGNADATNDFSMLGTISGGAARDLVWSGGGNGSWNTTAGNTPWTFSSSATSFVSNDNVTIGSAASIAVDSGGISVGSLAVSNSSGTVTLSGGSLTGTTLTKIGAGTLSLQVANVFAGGVSATGGTLVAGNSTAFGSLAVLLDTATLQITDPAVTTLSNTLAVANGDAIVNTGGNVTLTISGAISTTGTTGGVGVIKGDAQTFNTLTKTGPGKLTLTANLGTQMTYSTGNGTSGVTTTGGIALQIAGGSMEITNGRTWNLASGVLLDTFDSLGNQTASYNGMVWDGDVLMRGGTIQVNGGNIRGNGTITIGVLGESPVTNTIGQRLNFNSPDITNSVVITSGHTLTLSAAAGGAIGLLGNISGNGTITNTGTGTSNIMPASASAFTGNFVVVGKMGVNAQALAAAAGVNTGSLSTNVLTLDNKSSTSGAVVSAPINGLGYIVKTSDGDVALTGNNTFNGGLTLNSAGGILVDSVTGLGTGTITSSNAGAKVGISTAGASPLTIPNTLITGTADLLTSYYPVLAFVPGVGKTIVLTGPISGSGQLKVSGGGDLDLTGQTSNTNTGGIEIGTGRILASGDANLGTGTINFGTIANSHLVSSGVAGSATFSNAVTIGATSTAGYTANFDTNGSTVTLTGSISDKAGNVVGGALTKLGAGELILSGNLSYSGNTTVSAGTLTLNSANAANEASAVSIASAAFLKLNFSGTYTVAALFINGVQKSAGTYTSANSSGAIIGTGSLTVTTGPVVTDATPPVITLTGSASVAVNWGATYTDPGATATDNVDTSVTVTTTGTVNTAKPGVYTVTYTATDVANNAATPVTRTVTVSIANSTTVGADGYSPLLRYALGASAPADIIPTPVTTSTATTLSITAVVRVNDPALTIGAEAATDLTAAPGATGAWGTLGTGTITVTNAADQSGVSVGITARKVFTVDTTGASKKFLRLKATL
ncbi:hypothetical protein IMCC26134_03000 [Verrucomicrobia bacterium IMCC26134]|nr:hypothetical protein IMCC26134_03000 [Verrucomicrobia bacterium IMCC26134]